MVLNRPQFLSMLLTLFSLLIILLKLFLKKEMFNVVDRSFHQLKNSHKKGKKLRDSSKIRENLLPKSLILKEHQQQ